MSGPTDLNPDLFPTQDYVLIGGDQSPGLATIKNLVQTVPWDIRKAYQFSGATVVPKGDDLATFDVLFELWEGAHLSIWGDYYRKYFSAGAKFVGASGIPRALGIQHPILAQLGITEVVVTKRGGLEQDETGLWSATIGFLQYRKPKPSEQQPVSSIAAASVPQPNAKDANDTENATLHAQLKSKHDGEIPGQ